MHTASTVKTGTQRVALVMNEDGKTASHMLVPVVPGWAVVDLTTGEAALRSPNHLAAELGDVVAQRAAFTMLNVAPVLDRPRTLEDELEDEWAGSTDEDRLEVLWRQLDYDQACRLEAEVSGKEIVVDFHPELGAEIAEDDAKLRATVAKATALADAAGIPLVAALKVYLGDHVEL
jgi:hypothetical protein